MQKRIPRSAKTQNPSGPPPSVDGWRKVGGVLRDKHYAFVSSGVTSGAGSAAGASFWVSSSGIGFAVPLFSLSMFVVIIESVFKYKKPSRSDNRTTWHAQVVRLVYMIQTKKPDKYTVYYIL